MTDVGGAISQLQKQIKDLQRASRLSYASLDDTALEVRDDSGTLRGIVGRQGDGTTAVTIVNGPPPPQPSAPIIASVLGGVTASWDGLFVNRQVLPLDWSRTEVHAATASGFVPDTTTLRSTIETAQGATVVIPVDEPVYVRLVARNTSGAPSVPSGETGPCGPAAVVATDILDGIVTTLKLADDAVTTAKVATGAIGAAKITDNAITTPKIAAGAVQAAQLDALAVNASKIAAGAVTTAKLDTLAVTADKIAANAITVGKIAAGSVDATALKADAITGKTITGGTIIGTTVTGSTVRTSASGQRVVITPSGPENAPTVELWSGASGETYPSELYAHAVNVNGQQVARTFLSTGSTGSGASALLLNAPNSTTSGSAELFVEDGPSIGVGGTEATIGVPDSTGSPHYYTFSPTVLRVPSNLNIFGTQMQISGSEIRLQAQSDSASLSMYIRPTGITVEGRIVSDPNWSSLVTSTGWSGYGGAYGPGRYRRMPDGSIILRDLINRTATTTLINGEIIATLPTGYRPVTTVQQNAWVGGSTGGSLSVNINTAGTISVTNFSSGAVAYLSTGNGYLSLNGFQYFLD